MPSFLRPCDFYVRACIPHRPSWHWWQFGAKVAYFCILCFHVSRTSSSGTLTWKDTTCGAATVCDRRGAWVPPWCEVPEILRRAALGCRVERAQSWVAQRGITIRILDEFWPHQIPVERRDELGVDNDTLTTPAGRGTTVPFVEKLHAAARDFLARDAVAPVRADIAAVVEPEAGLAIAPGEIARIVAVRRGARAPVRGVKREGVCGYGRAARSFVAIY